MQRQQQGPTVKRNINRFIYYLSGLAIGCVLGGFLWQARSCSARREGGGAGVVAPQTKP